MLAGRLAPGAADRPLLADRDPAGQLAKLLTQRRHLYAQAHARIDAAAGPEAVVAALARALVAFVPPEPQTRRVRTAAAAPRSAYDVVSGRGLLAGLPALLAERLPARCATVISDDAVWPIAGPLLERALAPLGLALRLELVPAGEASKSTAQAERLWGALARAGAERREPIIAVGGGVVGDLAGFVAATYLRGVPFVQVPTSLLAQVDSSIGGKVAVDHPLAKNMIGAFKAPDLVLVDTALLAALPPEQVANGWAEVLKEAVILDADLFASMEASAERLADLAPELTLAAVRRSLELKARVVEEDEFEAGPRMLLNYGHTLGHAIEAAAGYGGLLHGQAVSLGMVAANWIAERLGLLEAGTSGRIERTLARLGLPVRLESVDAATVLATMQRDKKVRQGRITWVLPRGLGAAVRTSDVPPELPAQALDYLMAAPRRGAAPAAAR